MSTIAGTGPARPVIRRVARLALDALFPPLCAMCRASVQEPGSLCARCWGTMSFIDGPLCNLCGLPFDLDPGAETTCAACHAHKPAFDHARAVLRYDDASRGLILALKWGDRLDLSHGFAHWLRRSGSELLDRADIIVPVPLHRRRLWMRRYNQAAALAANLARLTTIPSDPLILRRIRSTPSQGEMPSAKARQRNVRGAFGIDRARKAALAGKTILLVDDVFTTGATLNACARALKRGGASRVDVLALARVVRPNSG